MADSRTSASDSEGSFDYFETRDHNALIPDLLNGNLPRTDFPHVAVQDWIHTQCYSVCVPKLHRKAPTRDAGVTLAEHSGEATGARTTLLDWLSARWEPSVSTSEPSRRRPGSPAQPGHERPSRSSTSLPAWSPYCLLPDQFAGGLPDGRLGVAGSLVSDLTREPCEFRLRRGFRPHSSSRRTTGRTAYCQQPAWSPATRAADGHGDGPVCHAEFGKKGRATAVVTPEQCRLQASRTWDASRYGKTNERKAK